MTHGWGNSFVVVLRWKSLNLTDTKSTLVQVMAWCRQATSHYLSHSWPKFISPYSVTMPRWVNAEYPRHAVSRQSCGTSWWISPLVQINIVGAAATRFLHNAKAMAFGIGSSAWGHGRLGGSMSNGDNRCASGEVWTIDDTGKLWMD